MGWTALPWRGISHRGGEERELQRWACKNDVHKSYKGGGELNQFAMNKASCFQVQQASRAGGLNAEGFRSQELLLLPSRDVLSGKTGTSIFPELHKNVKWRVSGSIKGKKPNS